MADSLPAAMVSPTSSASPCSSSAHVVRREVGVPQHLARVRASGVDLAVGAQRDRHAGHDPRRRPARLARGLRDARDHVVADRPLVGHPEDGPGGVLTGDAQHHGRERGDEDRHLDGIGHVHRAVHPVLVVLDVDRARPRERLVQHLEVVPHEVGRALVREAELTLDDPVVRRPEAEREPAAARHLRGQRLLRHRDGMTGLDRDDRGADLDALGHLADDRDRGHGVEVAGDLRDPHRGEPGLIGGLDVGHQPRQAARRVRAPCRSRSSTRCAFVTFRFRGTRLRGYDDPTRGARRCGTGRRTGA